jgi:hypothetical protein
MSGNPESTHDRISTQWRNHRVRLVQLKAEDVRRLAVVAEPWLRLIQGFDPVYALAQEAIRRGRRLASKKGSRDPASAKAPLAKGAVYLVGVPAKLIVHVTGSDFPSKLTISELSCSRLCAEILRPSFAVTLRCPTPTPFGT